MKKSDLQLYFYTLITKPIKPEEVETYDETEVDKQKGATDDQV